MSAHRRPTIRFSEAPRGTCRWCGEGILHGPGPKQGKVDYRRRWHPACVAEYNLTDPREARRRVRKRDRGVCRTCGIDTDALRRKLRGKGRAKRMRELGFLPRRSLWELDHVVPLIEGGGHDTSNLQTLCVPCHRKKSAEETRVRARNRRDEPPQPEMTAPDSMAEESAAPDAGPPASACLDAAALDPEVQDPEVQDPEVQDPEVQATEVQDSEVREPEVREPEVRASKAPAASARDSASSEPADAALDALFARADAANARAEALLEQDA